jgi:hypothetical protein
MDFSSLTTILSVFLLANLCLILIYATGKRDAKPGLTLFYLGLVALIAYSGYGSLFPLRSSNPAYTAVTKEVPSKSYYHFFDAYHQYMGSKYFDMVGYDGLYNATILADSELEEPKISSETVRDLTDLPYTISTQEALKRGEAIKDRTAPEEWINFKEDVAYMNVISLDEWMNILVKGPGTQNSPAWHYVAATTAMLLPINTTWEYGKLLFGEHGEQVEILPLLDLGLLLIAILFLWKSFGLVGVGSFLILFGISYISSMQWTGGSYLRFLWLSCFIISFSQFASRRFFTAGLFMGLAAVFEPFLITFALAGVLVYLLHRVQKKEERLKGMWFFLAAFLLSAGALGGLSIQKYGQDAWKNYAAAQADVRSITFQDTIGYKSLLLMGNPDLNAAYSEVETTEDFIEVDKLLSAQWEETFKILMWPMLLLVVGALYAARRVLPHEGMFIIGTTLMYLFLSLPGYYYVILTLVPLTLYHPFAAGKRARMLLALFFAFWAVSFLAPFIFDTLIEQYYYINLSFAVFLTLWIFTSIVLRPDYRQNEVILERKEGAPYNYDAPPAEQPAEQQQYAQQQPAAQPQEAVPTPQGGYVIPQGDPES